MKESTIIKVYGMIQQKNAIEAKIAKALNGKTNHVEPPTPKLVKTNWKIAKLRVLQGRYLGAVRPLTKTQRKQVSKIREANGYTKAIAKAKQLAG